MEELLSKIHRIETKHLSNLYRHLESIFNNVSLPSHNLQHHIRVWLHCRGLLIELHKAGLTITEQLIENAIIACFFHDAGLTKTLDEQHGAEGAELCKQYLSHFPDLTESQKTLILKAVELHDDKSVKQHPVTKPDDMLDLALLVSTADDLDALGFVGVFRYTEIYLKRGISIDQLPRKVLANLRNRFTSFTNAYSSLHRYSDRQRQRYREIMDFFTKLEGEISQGITYQDSAYAVVNTLHEQLVIQSNSIEQTIDYALSTLTASYPLTFFKRLQLELEVTSAIPI
ncbi:HD domain-containing protein [Tenuifilum osseticum]|uniref:HD domain-containing protein n=1 Tax=Tenuifilum osseticum TaxID=3374723 RepID=UPI0034E555E1